VDVWDGTFELGGTEDDQAEERHDEGDDGEEPRTALATLTKEEPEQPAKRRCYQQCLGPSRSPQFASAVHTIIMPLDIRMRLRYAAEEGWSSSRT